jgi:hypothetical protein
MVAIYIQRRMYSIGVKCLSLVLWKLMMVANGGRNMWTCSVTRFKFDGIIIHLHINQRDGPRCSLLRYTIDTLCLENLESYIWCLFKILGVIIKFRVCVTKFLM